MKNLGLVLLGAGLLVPMSVSNTLGNIEAEYKKEIRFEAKYFDFFNFDKMEAIKEEEDEFNFKVYSEKGSKLKPNLPQKKLNFSKPKILYSRSSFREPETKRDYSLLVPEYRAISKYLGKKGL